MMKPLMARRIKLEASMRCDFCHKLIPAGHDCYLIMGGDYVKAQGRYHGVGCYQAALKDYEKKEKELGLEKQARE